jgi:hypothetical protein
MFLYSQLSKASIICIYKFKGNANKEDIMIINSNIVKAKENVTIVETGIWFEESKAQQEVTLRLLKRIF